MFVWAAVLAVQDKGPIVLFFGFFLDVDGGPTLL